MNLQNVFYVMSAVRGRRRRQKKSLHTIVAEIGCSDSYNL